MKTWVSPKDSPNQYFPGISLLLNRQIKSSFNNQIVTISDISGGEQDSAGLSNSCSSSSQKPLTAFGRNDAALAIIRPASPILGVLSSSTKRLNHHRISEQYGSSKRASAVKKQFYCVIIEHHNKGGHQQKRGG